jgi:sterol desaturase/sphingolipid hydroxylase (fatty acid hydroxylase superfamily)
MNTVIIQQQKNQTVGFVQALAFFMLLFFLLLAPAVLIKTNRVYFHLLLLFNGWLTWTFTEYCQHRFHSHAVATRHQNGLITLHQYHHHHPTDIKISPLLRMTLFTLSVLFICLAIRLNNYFTLFAGYFLGFTGYTFMHWFLHIKVSARIFPVLHRFHIHHHCKYPDHCFGVSVPWWDQLFKTVPQKDAVISDRILTFYYKKVQMKK